MIIFIKKKNKYLFYNKQKQILVVKDKPLFTFKKTHANLVLNQIASKKKKNQYALINLTYFSCALSIDDKKKIIEKLLDFLKNDLILFRFFEDEELKNLMNKKLNLYVENFSKTFKTKLSLVNHLHSSLKKLNTTNFKKFLSELDVFLLSCIYKLTCLTKSVILSYFFIIKKIDFKKLFELTNIENNYQQKRWGYVDEQKKIDLESIEILKNISIFFKNIN